MNGLFFVIVILTSFIPSLFPFTFYNIKISKTSILNFSNKKNSLIVHVVYGNKPEISIEYCTGCKWLLRSAWLAQELLTTFEKDIKAVTLQPSNATPGGVFIVRMDGEMIWDRTKDATKGFPEAKILKQLIRDKIDPSMSLGHSDSKESKVIEITSD